MCQPKASLLKREATYTMADLRVILINRQRDMAIKVYSTRIVDS